jgi:transposase
LGAKEHAQEWLVFPENVGEHLSIDETSLSQGELYTLVTNKSGKGRKGTIVAIVLGTESEKVIQALERIPEEVRDRVKEITLDMADSMRKIVKRCFTGAIRVTSYFVRSTSIDRFHVQKLAYDALQEMRIAHRWDAINQETDAIEETKLSRKKYISQTLENGDSKKQLLARSRYLLFKSAEKWTDLYRVKTKT